MMRIRLKLLILFIFSNQLSAAQKTANTFDVELNRVDGDFLRSILNKDTSYSVPQKEQLCPNSPIIERYVKSISKDGKDFKILSSTDNVFHQGCWSHLNPKSFQDAIAFDADDKAWDEIVNRLNFTTRCWSWETLDPIPNCNIQSDEVKFIALVMKLIYNEINNIEPLLTYDRNNNKDFVCCHYATLILPIFSKLLEKSPLFSGKIHQITSFPVNNDLKIVDDGHVWNMLSLTNKKTNKDSSFVIDLYNLLIADLSSNYIIPELDLYYLDLHNEHSNVLIHKFKLKDNQPFLDYVITSNKKFRIIPTDKRKNVYLNKEALEIIAHKVYFKKQKPN
jgi:hypothetical protein